MNSLNDLLDCYARHDIVRLFVKKLAPNDNYKNQPYVGSGDSLFTAMNFLPNSGFMATEVGKSKNPKAALNFWWLSDECRLDRAPGAKLIYYKKYPEVRLSGFVAGAPSAPSELMDPAKRGREPGRVLFLGVSGDGKVIAYMISSDSPIAGQLSKISGLSPIGALLEIPILLLRSGFDSTSQLLQLLCHISRKGWIRSQRLDRNGRAIEYVAPNAAGYTLEAEFGIAPNGRPLPDYLDWELKQHNVNKFNKFGSGSITLMTPEPTGGFYGLSGSGDFVDRYGYAPKDGTLGRKNFSGRHFVGETNKTTKLGLALDGFDPRNPKNFDLAGSLVLLDGLDRVAASWKFGDLLDHWSKKHGRVAYVQSQKRKQERKTRYSYGQIVRLGQGANFLRFLGALSERRIYWDPGLHLKYLDGGKTRARRRNQFRVRSSDLARIYDTFEIRDACVDRTLREEL